jgi:hypothetical protein
MYCLREHPLNSLNALVILNFHFLLQTEYIPLLHHVSKILEDHITLRQKLHANCMNGIRLFSLLPIASFTSKHIHLDTTGLVEAQRFLGIVEAQYGDKSLWEKYFRTAVGGDRDRRRFSHHIDTDGVSVSLHLEKPGKDKKGEEELEPEILTSTTAESWYVKETSDLDQGVRDARIPDDIQRRIYIDPGGTTMAACVLEGDCKSDPRIVNCGKAEYRHMASMDRLRQKREKLRKASGLEDVMTNLPTPRGSSVRSMFDHLEALFVHLEDILEHYGTSKHLNMKFTGYSRREKAMEAMVDRIAPRGVKTLAVYGAADFPHTMKGMQDGSNNILY